MIWLMGMAPNFVEFVWFAILGFGSFRGKKFWLISFSLLVWLEGFEFFFMAISISRFV